MDSEGKLLTEIGQTLHYAVYIEIIMRVCSACALPILTNYAAVFNCNKLSVY